MTYFFILHGCHLLFVYVYCMQEVIGKSVHQAVFFPLYSVPERYDPMSLLTIYIIQNALKTVCCLYVIMSVFLLALKTLHAFLNFHLCE